MANLIDNAIKHSPRHGRVTVHARRGEGPQSLVLEVQDEGPGIPEAERYRVFERFNRGGPAPRAPAATAVRAWAWRSRAGRWICTADASASRNRPAVAGSGSLFRGWSQLEADGR